MGQSMGCCTGKTAATAPPSSAPDENTYTSKAALARALGEKHTVLIDATFFVEQRDRGGVFLSRQEMEVRYPNHLVKDIRPEDIFQLRFDPDYDEFIDMGSAGTWLLVAISYPWLDRAHPDPHGAQLTKLAGFFRRLLADVTPQGKRVAAFLDFSSLYQNHPEQRTAAQKELFNIGLKSVNLWYGHQCVVVVALTDTVDDACANTIPYHGRGWTTFEWKVSLLASDFVFDLRHIVDVDRPMLSFHGNLNGQKLFKLGALGAARVIADPVTPPRVFDGIVEQKTFTAGKVDCDFVKTKYEQTLQAILGKTERLDYRSVQWSAEDLNVFAVEIIPMCASLKEMHLDDVSAVSDDCTRAIAQGCAGLQALSLSGCSQLTDASISAVARGCAKLHTLSLDRCDKITDSSIAAVARGCANLQQLKLGGCCQLTDDSITAVARCCANLQALNLEGCAQLTDASITAVAQGCADLRQLYLQGCGQLTDESIAAVARKCANLQALYLGGCCKLTDGSIVAVARGCRSLRQLGLSDCGQLTDDSITVVARQCSKLQALDLDGCWQLTNASVTTVARRCAHLQQLGLSGCGHLTDASVAALAKGCAKLHTLFLDGCGQLTDASIAAVAKGCAHLQELSLNGCGQLTDTSIAVVARRCANLRALYLTECCGVTDRGIALVREHRPNVEITSR